MALDPKEPWDRFTLVLLIVGAILLFILILRARIP